jgi:hypothetical protein
VISHHRCAKLVELPDMNTVISFYRIEESASGIVFFPEKRNQE